ncbi:MAG: polyprenyl synthetase family protein [archaeon]
MEELIPFLENNRDIIDKKIEKYLPKKIDSAYLEWLAGPARYTYDIDSIQKCIIDPTWNLLNRGGKRWRPNFFILIVESLGKDADNLLDFAIIPELIHNGTLIIDDVEDNSDKRRNKPTIHNIYGTDIAINAGNALYYIPLKIIDENKNKLGPELTSRAYEVYVQEMINLSLGQAMDIWWHRGKNNNVSVEQYLQMCAYKTGTLARLTAKLAVILSSGTEKQEEKISKIAESIGIGFQIQDDILDMTSDEREKFGKSFGNDIHEGKRTLMVIHTLNSASEKDKKRLAEILDKHTRDEKLINEAFDIINKYKSIEFAKSTAKKIIEEAWNEVDVILPESKSKQMLSKLVTYLIERKI